MGMIRKQIYLTPEQDAKLKRLARMNQQTEAEIVRAALDNLSELTEPLMARLQEHGLLAKPAEPQISLEFAAINRDYQNWLKRQTGLTLSDAVLAERAESR
jgi:antitoxin ParD1/3/4